MIMRKLELKDIAGYLPHGLKICIDDGLFVAEVQNVIGVVNGRYVVDDCYYCSDELRTASVGDDNDIVKPILRPFSDLYQTITHNGKEIVPIVEIGKMVDNTESHLWKISEYCGNACAKKRISYLIFNQTGKFEYSGYNVNSIEIFDFLNELKIDYRGLIKAGLAVDCNTLEINPYK
jgi:hypothetical protein